MIIFLLHPHPGGGMHLSSADDDPSYLRGRGRSPRLHIAFNTLLIRQIPSTPTPPARRGERKKKEGYRNEFMTAPATSPPSSYGSSARSISFYLHIAIMFPLLLYDNPHAN
ncbi:hypothetical protein CEXT_147261 [Caerostris extrusa]|uniref:Uncharacterized protein n=1 Tax=Caerostris extrusa TaxID=172846 RepID=A0AAV4SVB0_CAEEX|nr:hypothetical protein CEXT_147261 [Caerostris extrusa]